MTEELDHLRARIAELEDENAKLKAAAGGDALPFGEGLSEREALLSEAEQIAHMGSWMWDTQTGSVRWSDELYNIMGLVKTPAAPTAEMFFGGIHPEDVGGVQATAQRGVETGHPEPVEFRIMQPDGTERQVRMMAAVVFDADGNPSRFVGTILDVTEARRAEDLLKRSASQLNEAQRVARVGSWAYDVGSGDLDWSDELYRIHGIEKSVIPIHELYIGVHPDDLEGLQDAVQHSMTGGAPEVIEYRIVRPDGDIRHVIMHSRVIRDDRGEPTRFVGTVLDNTERRLLEEQLRHSQRMEAIGRLAGGIAHDFNNYLLVIEGNAEIMGQIVDEGGPLAESVGEIVQACQRCTALTRQLLTFGRKQVLDPVVIDVAALTTKVSRMLERVLGENIRLVAEHDVRLQAVKADPNQLEQALINLAVNARDAMPEGGKVTIKTENAYIDTEFAETHPDFSAGRYVRLSVVDTGEGISSEDLLRVFEPFYTTKDAGKGSGLGLSTVHGIAHQTGGSVTIESEVGKGTAVRIYLPAVADESVRPPPTSSESEYPGGSETVLLVEDQPQVRHLVQSLLVQGGYTVLAAGDGIEALDLLAASDQVIDLLLTDVMMPRMGGVALVSEFVADRPGVPVVFMSGYAEEGTVRDEVIAKGYPFIQKPFTLGDLLNTVRAALDA